MGTKDLKNRSIWQDYSGKNSLEAEKDFYSTFQRHFKDSVFEISDKPKEFDKIYVDVDLSNSILDEIYTPEVPIKRHGIKPDYSIKNKATDKTLYIEVKRQDGWVEGKSRSAGRGNAHERSCKYFTPGLLRILREAGKISEDILPFWTVFIGDITRDPCRVREIALWYDTYTSNYFMWRNQKDPTKLLEHFDSKLRRFLG